MPKCYAVKDIEYPHLYEAAIRRNIVSNAQKTWRKSNPDTCVAIETFLIAGRVECARQEIAYTDNFVGSLAKAFDTYGKLSEKQGNAVVKIIADSQKRQVERQLAIEAQKARSEFLGVASEKITTRAYVEAVLIVDAPKFSYYDSASALVYLMRDEKGNKLVYKSKSALRFKFSYGKNAPDSWNDWGYDIQTGMTIDFTATIKCHAESKGEKQTNVQRVKVSGLELKEGAIKEAIDKRS